MSLPLQNHPGFLLYDTARLFRGCLGRELRDLGLSEPQWRLVSSINRFEALSQTELATLLGIGKAPLGKLVDRLEAEQLLARRPDPKDRRRKTLHLTPAGHVLAQQIIERYHQLRPALMLGISDGAVQRLENALLGVYQKITAFSSELSRLPVGQLTVIHLVSAISRWNRRKFDRQLIKLGISRPQWLVMIAIADTEGAGQGDLSQLLQMHKVALGQLLDELEDSGWVERRVNPADRRARLLFLTPHARAEIHKQASIYEQLHEEFLADVSSDERRQLATTLQSLRDNLQQIARQQLQQDHGAPK